MLIESFLLLAVNMAASLSKLAKSAPVNPGVLLATLSKSTSFERVLSFA